MSSLQACDRFLLRKQQQQQQAFNSNFSEENTMDKQGIFISDAASISCDVFPQRQEQSGAFPELAQDFDQTSLQHQDSSRSNRFKYTDFVSAPNIDIEDELLVQEVYGHRCLWDTSARAFKEINKKTEAWKVVAEHLGQNEDMLKKRWKGLRDGFHKCIKKIDSLTRSGAGASKLPTCRCFAQLQFLKDSVSNRQTETNLPVTNNSFAELATDVSNNSCSSSPLSSPPLNLSGQVKRKTLSEPTVNKKMDRKDQIDMLLVQALSQENVTRNASDENLDPDLLFLKSILPVMKGLTPRKNRLMKIEIQEMCLKYEFNEEEGT